MSVAADGWGILSESAVGVNSGFSGENACRNCVALGLPVFCRAFTTTSVSAGVVVC